MPVSQGRRGMSGLALQLHVQLLDLFPCPRRLAQESQARLDGRVALEAAHIDALGQALPLVVRNQLGEDLFEGLAVQRVVLGRAHASAP